MANRDVSILLDLAARQHGLVTRAQANGAGVSDGRLARLRRDGVLDSVARGVMRVVGMPATWEQAMCGAILGAGAGAVASHRAAARLHELEGFDEASPELTIPHGRHGVTLGARLHHSTDISGARTVRLKGMRATDATRTLVDLGSVVDDETLEIALDDALRRRLTTVDRLGVALGRWRRPGRSGAPELCALLRRREGEVGIPDTGFERRLLRILREAHLPLPVTQHELYDDEGVFVTRFDGAYPAVHLGIEADSERWHMGRARFVGDRTKRARAEALGWHVLAFTDHHVRRERGFVADMVGRSLKRLGVT